MLRLIRENLSMDAFRTAAFSKRTATALILAIPVLVGIFIAGELGRNVGNYTRDIPALFEISPLTGLLSTLGLLVWAGSAAVWYCCRILAEKRGDRRMRRFATASLFLTLWLVLDDSFMIHEGLIPNHLPFPEKGVLALVACAGLAYVVLFRNLLASALFPLAFAFVPLALSLIIDDVGAVWITDRIGDWEFLLEDGLKWLGIVGWLGHALLWFRRLLDEQPR
ncbi:MAG: hypothetical protein J7494_08925 [Sphingobium sp.]|nr:hypothetical protein [Sphingobium sp.]